MAPDTFDQLDESVAANSTAHLPIPEAPTEFIPRQFDVIGGADEQTGDEAEALIALKNLEERRRKKRRQKLVRIGAGAAAAVAIIGGVVLRGVFAKPSNEEYVPSTAIVERRDFKTTVQGTGSLEPASLVVVTPEVDGIIEAVHVTEGQQVKPGDVICTIKNNDLDKAISDAARAVSEAGDLVCDAETALANLQAAYAKDKAAYEAAAAKAAEAETRAAAAGQAAYDKVIEKPEQEYQEAINAHDAAADAYTEAQERVERADQAVKECQAAYDADPTPENLEALTKAKTEKANADSDLPFKKLELDNADVKMENANTRYELARKEAEAAYSQAYASVPIPPVPDFSEAAYTSQIDSARSAVTSAQNTLKTAQEAYDTAVENASKRTVKTPKGGTVLSLTAKVGARAGGSGNNAGSVAQVADLSQMKVSISINEIDISNVKVGQKAKVTFSALPDLEMTAEVVSVASLSSSASEGTFGGGGVVTFPVELVIKSPDPRLKPGMSASVTIATQDVPDVLIIPSMALVEDGSVTYVNVVVDEETFAAKRREVSVGARSSSEAVIESGLEEGEVILLDTTFTMEDGSSEESGIDIGFTTTEG